MLSRGKNLDSIFLFMINIIVRVMNILKIFKTKDKLFVKYS